MAHYSFLSFLRVEDKEYHFENLVGPGWWSLLEELCQKIQMIVDQKPATYQTLQVVQIKEKFGTLRFYLNGETSELSSLIEDAEKRSAQICEFCGQPGQLRTDRGWRLTLCDTCNQKETKDLANTEPQA